MKNLEQNNSEEQKSFFFRVTTISKVSTAILFVALPFLGFWVGEYYVNKHNENLDKIPSIDTFAEDVNFQNKLESISSVSTSTVVSEEFSLQGKQEQLFVVKFDNEKKLLVTNSDNSDRYRKSSYTETRVTSFSEKDIFVTAVPSETIIFDQQFDDNSKYIYAIIWKSYLGAQYVDTGNKKFEIFPSVINGTFEFIVFDIANKTMVRQMPVPENTSIQSISTKDTLVALRSADCRGCDAGLSATKTFVVDVSGVFPGYHYLGPIHDITFAGNRVVEYKTLLPESPCEGLGGCYKPGETATFKL
ncbi:MAG: hypothetical protein RLZZ76_480 [Candidatus Parcubacteria bacterium]|jgi:hypothetical protein